MTKSWGIRILFLLGVLFSCIPMVGGIISAKDQADAVKTYQKAVVKQEDNSQEHLQKAQEYNRMLYQANGALVDHLDKNILSDESYVTLLDVSGTGVMGSLDIPVIGVSLPIYHGTDDASLSQGIGHLQGSSLPVGGENTHCVLTGHRGLPQSKLLTRLDEVQKEDYFFLHVSGQTLAYKVNEIKVVEPDNVSVMEFRPGKDVVSIVTCTPYGLNTHRLIVSGERVEYQEADYLSIQEKIPSGREILISLVPVLFILMAIIKFYIDYKRKKKQIRRKKRKKRRQLK